MFEHKTFESILQEMLDRVSDDVDKREGSIIYDALAPTALVAAEQYADMDLLLSRTFADSADGDDLERRVGEHGVKRKKSSKAIRRGSFTDGNSSPFDVPLTSRFRLGEIVYRVVDRIEKGSFRLEAETDGIVGNQDYGELLPLEPIDGLGGATLSDVLIPGENEESDESLYAKYIEYINEIAFGGNRADYKRNILAINGVGAVRLTRAPFGGGTVIATIIDSDFNVPTAELVETVQSVIDPVSNTGDGFGTAPIGHEVTIVGGESKIINFETTLTLTGVSLGQVEPLVGATVDDYLAEVRKDWHKDLPLTVRILHLESRILMIEGIEDVTDSTLNGLTANIVLSHEVPVKGTVVLHDGTA